MFPGDCGSMMFGSIYFCSYIFFIVCVIINMYIAVILDQFSQAQAQDAQGISEDDIESFYEIWQVYDPKATQFIPCERITDLLDGLEPPFHLPKPNLWFLQASEIPINEDHAVHCLDVLVALMQYTMGDEPEDEDSEGFQSIRDRLEERYNAVFSKRAKQTNLLTTEELLNTQNKVSSKIQRLTRWYLLMENMRTSDNGVEANDIARDKTLNRMADLVTEIAKIREKKHLSLDEDEEIDFGDCEDMQFDDHPGIKSGTPDLLNLSNGVEANDERCGQ